MATGVVEIDDGTISKHASHMTVGMNSELTETWDRVVERGGGRGGEGGRCLRSGE